MAPKCQLCKDDGYVMDYYSNLGAHFSNRYACHMCPLGAVWWEKKKEKIQKLEKAKEESIERAMEMEEEYSRQDKRAEDYEELVMPGKSQK